MSEARVAFVTGANKGIGLACARLLQDQGYKVAVGYRSTPPRLEPDNQGFDLFPVLCDVTSTSQVEDAFKSIEEHWGPVEILVANAGITKDQIAVRMKDEDWDEVINANLTGSFRVARRASTKMLRLKTGRIIFISSVVAAMGQAGQANYCASKAGLVGLARALARELASRSITVNVVAPGAVRTDMLQALGSEVISSFESMIPMGRTAEAIEIAQAVAFLASCDASYITGVVLPVDGGLGMGD